MVDAQLFGRSDIRVVTHSDDETLVFEGTADSVIFDLRDNHGNLLLDTNIANATFQPPRQVTLKAIFDKGLKMTKEKQNEPDVWHRATIEMGDVNVGTLEEARRAAAAPKDAQIDIHGSVVVFRWKTGGRQGE